MHIVGNNSKGRISRRTNKKTEHVKFSKNDTHTYVWVSRGKECSFFWKFGELCFLLTPVLRYTLLPYYQQYVLVFAWCCVQYNKCFRNFSYFAIYFTSSYASKINKRIGNEGNICYIPLSHHCDNNFDGSGEVYFARYSKSDIK